MLPISVINILAAENDERLENLREANLERRRMRQDSDPFSIEETRFKELFKINKDMAQYLFNGILPDLERGANPVAVPSHIKFFGVLAFYATGSYQRVLGRSHDISVSQQTMSRAIHEVTNALIHRFSDRFIVFPRTQQDKNNIKEMFMASRNFPGVIGAIDCTHVEILRPVIEEHNYLNRKGYHSKNIQIICDHNLKILNIKAQFAGATHDSYIWRQSRARALLESEYTRASKNRDSEEFLKIISMKASIVYEKAKILLSENLLPECRDYLKESLLLIKDYSDHPKIAFLHMRIVNHLTYVLSRLGSLDEAEEMLIKAIENEKKCTPEVYSTDDLFLNIKKDEQVSTSKLHRLSINNMQMLAWIYARLDNTEANLKLQHDILQKQLHHVDEFDSIKWADSCFRLAGMFVTNGDWENAIYHLLAAEVVLSPLEASLIPNPDAFAAGADLARSWIYYGLQLFEASRKPVLLKNVLSMETEAELPTESLPCYTFDGIDVIIPKEIPCSKIGDLEQAKKLFDHVHKWVKRARLFYTLRDFPLQYVNLCLDLSELYRFMGFFEKDLESQYAVQKRRYDSLETLSNILREVRPICYVAVSVELTKELIEVQMEMMNLNLKKLYNPPEELKLNFNEELVRRQMNAYSSLHDTLENISSTLNTSTKKVESLPAEPLSDKRT